MDRKKTVQTVLVGFSLSFFWTNLSKKKKKNHKNRPNRPPCSTPTNRVGNYDSEHGERSLRALNNLHMESSETNEPLKQTYVNFFFFLKQHTLNKVSEISHIDIRRLNNNVKKLFFQDLDSFSAFLLARLSLELGDGLYTSFSASDSS